jgi:hypothetical protein
VREVENAKKDEYDDGNSSNSESDSNSLNHTTSSPSIADTTTVDSILGPHFHVQMPNLPPIPHAPMEPGTLDLTPYPDKEARKIAQKEHDRKVKAYKQAIKDRDSALKDREKLEAKMRKNAAKEILKQRNADDKKRDKSEKGKGKQKQSETPDTAATSSILSPTTTNTTAHTSPNLTRQTTLSQADSHTPLSPTSTKDIKSEKPEKPKRERKFCMLPSKNNAGERDPAWVRVFMKDMDEVGAHCGLFFLGPTYERLVGDVGADIEEWVKDDMTERMVREASQGY